MPNRGKHNVYVFQHPVRQTVVVRPAAAPGDHGKPFSFRNLTRYTLELDFPPGLMSGRRSHSIPPRKSRTFTVARDADGLYVYQIRFTRAGRTRKAIGESDPEIIID
jgi:hypothetical protein